MPSHVGSQVYDILESMRIGTLPEGERVVATDDPYATDPQRSGELVVRSSTPFNAETPLDRLLQWVTPNELHYVRHHMPVPDVVAQAFELKVRLAACDAALTRCPEHSCVGRLVPRHLRTVALSEDDGALMMQ
jgi:hypothetical protein